MTAPLSADLGRFAAPARARPFEDARLTLLDRLISRAQVGELTHAEWEAAYAASATTIRDAVVARATAAVAAGAARSRLPASERERLLPDAEQADALRNRLLACAIPLEQLADEGSDLSARRARGAALERSWEAATVLAIAEGARWERVAALAAEWRPARAPRLVALGALTLGLVIVAAWLGGQFPAPAWFTPVHAAFWNLPWP